MRAARFTLGPEPLGIEERGREIVTFLPGCAGGSPRPALMFSDATLDAVARMLRGFHDATAGLAVPPGVPWPFPTPEPVEVACHKHVAPYNLISPARYVTGVIGFDLASPSRGSGTWPTPCTASSRRSRRRTPSHYPAWPSTSAGPPASARCTATPRSARAGCCGPGPIARLRDLNAFMHREAAAANAAQQAILDRGRGRIYEIDAACLARATPRLVPDGGGDR